MTAVSAAMVLVGMARDQPTAGFVVDQTRQQICVSGFGASAMLAAVTPDQGADGVPNLWTDDAGMLTGVPDDPRSRSPRNYSDSTL
jgi:hypothetical protein